MVAIWLSEPVPVGVTPVLSRLSFLEVITSLCFNVGTLNPALKTTAAMINSGKVDMNAAERAAKAEHNAEMQRRRSIVRSSSAGAPAGARGGDAPLSGARSKSAAVAGASRRT